MQTRYHRTNARKRGFTMVELIVVMAIIVGLVALFSPQILKNRSKAVQTGNYQELTELQSACDRYVATRGYAPATLGATGFMDTDARSMLITYLFGDAATTGSAEEIAEANFANANAQINRKYGSTAEYAGWFRAHLNTAKNTITILQYRRQGVEGRDRVVNGNKTLGNTSFVADAVTFATPTNLWADATFVNLEWNSD